MITKDYERFPLFEHNFKIITKAYHSNSNCINDVLMFFPCNVTVTIKYTLSVIIMKNLHKKSYIFVDVLLSIQSSSWSKCRLKFPATSKQNKPSSTVVASLESPSLKPNGKQKRCAVTSARSLSLSLTFIHNRSLIANCAIHGKTAEVPRYIFVSSNYHSRRCVICYL